MGGGSGKRKMVLCRGKTVTSKLKGRLVKRPTISSGEGSNRMQERNKLPESDGRDEDGILM